MTYLTLNPTFDSTDRLKLAKSQLEDFECVTYQNSDNPYQLCVRKHVFEAQLVEESQHLRSIIQVHGGKV